MKIIAAVAITCSISTGVAQGTTPPKPVQLMAGLSIKQQFETAWQGADVELKVEDL